MKSSNPVCVVVVLLWLALSGVAEADMFNESGVDNISTGEAVGEKMVQRRDYRHYDSSGDGYDGTNGRHVDDAPPNYTYYYEGGLGVFLLIMLLVCLVWGLQFTPSPPSNGYYYGGAIPCNDAPSAPPRSIIALRIDRRYDHQPTREEADSGGDPRQRLMML